MGGPLTIQRSRISGDVISLPSNSSKTLQQGIVKAKPLYGIGIDYRGRITFTANAGVTTGVWFPEVLANLLGTMRIEGSVGGGGGNITLLKASVAELLANNIFTMRNWPRHIGPTRLGNTGVATVSYDFVLQFDYDFVAKRIAFSDVLATILDPSRFSILQLQFDSGDVTKVAVSGGTNFTMSLSAFGSAAGNPSVTYTAKQWLSRGAPFGSHYMSRVSTQIDLAALAAGTELGLPQYSPILKKERIKSLQFRQYVQDAVGGGVVTQAANAASFLGQVAPTAQTGITRILLQRNNQDTKWVETWDGLTNLDANLFGLPSGRPSITSLDDDRGMPNGYMLLDFTGDSGSLADALDLTVGYETNTFNVAIDNTTPPANAKVDVLKESVIPV